MIGSTTRGRSRQRTKGALTLGCASAKKRCRGALPRAHAEWGSSTFSTACTTMTEADGPALRQRLVLEGRLDAHAAQLGAGAEHELVIACDLRKDFLSLALGE